jgi:hypothetical protein
MRADVTTVLSLYGICLTAFSGIFTILEVHSSASDQAGAGSMGALSFATWASVLRNASATLLSSLELGVEAFNGGDTDASRLTHRDPLVAAFVSLPVRILAHVITPLLMVNFLIAVMNKKQESVQQEADALWQLNRARMIESIDDELPDDDAGFERVQPDRKYWESKGDGRRHIIRFDEVKARPDPTRSNPEVATPCSNASGSSRHLGFPQWPGGQGGPGGRRASTPGA